MSEKLAAKVEVTINVPTSVVWKALTDPELIKQYFFGTHTESDWKVGSPITFSGEWEGKPYVDKGTILAIEEGSYLKYNYWSSMSGTEDLPENYADITYELRSQGNGTLLTITQEGIATQESKEHSEQNWAYVLDSMKQLLET